MTSPNDVAALVERGPDAMEALVHVAGTLGREGDKDSEDTIKGLADILAATIAALQAEVERAKEALAPFAAVADIFDHRSNLRAREDDTPLMQWADHRVGEATITLGDLRRARSASRKETTP